jgi:hypothetical protein
MHLGTIFVLVGAILFAIALLFHHTGEPRGRFFGVVGILALAGLFTSVGVLLGAPALVAVR